MAASANDTPCFEGRHTEYALDTSIFIEGFRSEAFALLNRAVDAHEAWLTYSLTDFSTLDDLRPDPRFKELRRRIGL